MKSVLITGGAGFIGSNLVDLHLELGHRVVVIDNLLTGDESNIAHNRGNPLFTFHRQSVQDCAALGTIGRDVDLVYHLAAVVGVRQVLKSPLAVLDTNVYAVDHLLRTLKDVNPGVRVVAASSSEVYGMQNNLPFKETDNLVMPSLDPLRWCYAVSKLSGEMIAFGYAREFGMNVTSIRLFNTVGVRQSPAYGMVLPNFVKRALRGEDLEIYGDGEQTRSFCDVRDMVRALEMIGQCNDAKGITVNIGTDAEISIKALAQRVIDIAKSPSRISYKSYLEAYGTDFVDIKRRRPDTSRMHALTGFRPRFSLDDTIASLIAASSGGF